MEHYSEIESLKQFAAATHCKVVVDSNNSILGVSSLCFQIKELVIQVLILDEYNDLTINNALLHLELVLREFTALTQEPDFLTWCKSQGLDANNTQLLTYYKNAINELPNIVHAVYPLTLENKVSDLDFQLNSGAAQALRQQRTRTA